MRFALVVLAGISTFKYYIFVLTFTYMQDICEIDPSYSIASYSSISQGTIGCTPNSVYPWYLFVFSMDSWGL